MKHWRCVQGDKDWGRLRMGKPTASAFDKLITPAKKEDKDGKILGWLPTKGETRRNYATYLLTELILDEPLAGVTTASLNHGHAFEENARSAYEMLIGKEVERCGFCTNDEMTYGASPDAFVGEDGSLEIKCPFKPEIHVAYMMDPGSFEEEYFVQTQGQIYVTNKAWTDLVSHFTALPMVRVRVFPEAEFQKRLDIAVRSFCAEFSDLVNRAMRLGFLQNRPPVTDWIKAGDIDMVRKGRQKEKQKGDFDITDEDVARIWGMAQARNDLRGVPA